MSRAHEGRVVSVNVGTPREFLLNGKRHTSAIWKEPVEGRVAVRGVNLAGDDQADRKVHGGTDKAIYAYALEDYEWWSEELGRDLGPGSFGDNLTVAGLALDTALVGERWSVGDTVLEVAHPRLPCYKLGVRMGDRSFPRQFAAAARWGAYLRIIEEGDIGAGDAATVRSRPGHRVTVGLIASIYHDDHTRATEMLAAPQLPESWRSWAVEASERAARSQPG
ncbi:MAG: MOSC domain-containing protein [Actinomycetota bacterium]